MWWSEREWEAVTSAEQCGMCADAHPTTNEHNGLVASAPTSRIKNATVVAALASVALLAGCTATSYDTRSHADYPAYESAVDLAADSTDVIRGTVLSSREDVLESEPFEGTDPETNPYYGTDTEQPAPGELTIDVTIFEVEIDQSYKGDVAGQVIEVSQLRDAAEGVALEVGGSYVLFLDHSDPAYPAGIVGGPQGQYIVEDGTVEPADESVRIDVSVEDLESL